MSKARTLSKIVVPDPAVADTYLRRNAANTGHEAKTITDIREELKTVDGAGSGLDADLLDGKDSTAFAERAGTTFTGLVRFESSAVPIELRETLQTLPAGLWRIATSGDTFIIDHNKALAGDFSSYKRPVRIHSDGTITLESSINQDAWIAPTLTNGWVNFGGTEETAGYYKDKQGTVWLKGLIKDGTINAAIFTLPSGYRPLKIMRFAAIHGSDFAYVYVRAAGEVMVFTAGANTSLDLSGISFRAA